MKSFVVNVVGNESVALNMQWITLSFLRDDCWPETYLGQYVRLSSSSSSLSRRQSPRLENHDTGYYAIASISSGDDSEPTTVSCSSSSSSSSSYSCTTSLSSPSASSPSWNDAVLSSDQVKSKEAISSLLKMRFLVKVSPANAFLIRATGNDQL
jgi:hypothetical protein